MRLSNPQVEARVYALPQVAVRCVKELLATRNARTSDARLLRDDSNGEDLDVDRVL